MRLSDVDSLELPATADMHVHLRQGDMMKFVVPTIRKGGVDTVFVMVWHGTAQLSPVMARPLATSRS